MNKLLVIFAVIASAAATDLDLNAMCSGALFRTIPHPTEPNLFIGCVQGKGTILGCRLQDEVFNQFSATCGTADLPASPPAGLCDNIVVGWFPNEEDCSRYIVCEASEPSLRSCPDGSIFNRFLPGCVPGNRNTCTFEHHTTPPPTTDAPTAPPTGTCPTVPPTPREFKTSYNRAI